MKKIILLLLLTAFAQTPQKRIPLTAAQVQVLSLRVKEVQLRQAELARAQAEYREALLMIREEANAPASKFDFVSNETDGAAFVEKAK